MKFIREICTKRYVRLKIIIWEKNSDYSKEVLQMVHLIGIVISEEK
ncbi:hypothetical protein [Niallia sp. Krafla_26]